MVGLVSVFAAQSLDLVGLAVDRAPPRRGRARLPAARDARPGPGDRPGDVQRDGGAPRRRGRGEPVVNDLFMTLGLPAVALAKLALVVLIGALCIASAARGGRGVWSMVGGLPLALADRGRVIGGITNTAVLLG